MNSTTDPSSVEAPPPRPLLSTAPVIMEFPRPSAMTNFKVSLVSFVLICSDAVMVLGSSSRGEKEPILDLGDIGLADRRRHVPTSVCLVGKICSDKSHNVFAVIDVMPKAFRPKGKFTARDWGWGVLIFSFVLREDRDWVLRNQPLHFDGCLFAIKPMTLNYFPLCLGV
ncbi:hypothetical protein ACS0TY_016886 [Phlomoides rotata]